MVLVVILVVVVVKYWQWHIGGGSGGNTDPLIHRYMDIAINRLNRPQANSVTVTVTTIIKQA